MKIDDQFGLKKLMYTWLWSTILDLFGAKMMDFGAIWRLFDLFGSFLNLKSYVSISFWDDFSTFLGSVNPVKILKAAQIRTFVVGGVFHEFLSEPILDRFEEFKNFIRELFSRILRFEEHFHPLCTAIVGI